jgi:hypothetical protein
MRGALAAMPPAANTAASGRAAVTAAVAALAPPRRPAPPREAPFGKLRDGCGDDVPACRAFPARHRTRPHPANPQGRSNKAGKRRADVVGRLPAEALVARLSGAGWYTVATSSRRETPAWSSCRPTAEAEPGRALAALLRGHSRPLRLSRHLDATIGGGDACNRMAAKPSRSHPSPISPLRSVRICEMGVSR